MSMKKELIFVCFVFVSDWHSLGLSYFQKCDKNSVGYSSMHEHIFLTLNIVALGLMKSVWSMHDSYSLLACRVVTLGQAGSFLIVD